MITIHKVSLIQLLPESYGRKMLTVDGVAAIARVTAARLPVVAVAEHDDQLTRKRALDAGATRVFSYRKFFEDGTRLVEGWLPTATGG